MLCKNPFMSGGAAFGCGQCLPCRINRSRVWSHRIMLEALQYTDNCFLTLTYDDAHLPAGESLVPADFRDFLKRLRNSHYPRQLRYFGVGEYGDGLQRPHYHAILFNYPTCVRGGSDYSSSRTSCCSTCDNVRSIWGKGFVHLGKVEDKSSAYVCGYVVKKMTASDDPRLFGRHPEFARMSRMPGIGFSAMHEVANVVMGNDELSCAVDVPTGLRHGNTIRPLGRYLSNGLRKLVGRPEGVPQEVLNVSEAEMLELREAAKASADNPSFKARLIERDAGKVASAEARYRIHKGRKVL